MSADPNTHISREAVLRNLDQLGINYEALPKAPFWGPMFGYSQESIKINAAGRVMFASASVGRPLTQPEKDAMAYYIAKGMVTLSYTPPIALGISFAFWRKGLLTYRFPFWQPKPEQFNPNKFAFLQGALAQRAWHGLRGLTYYSLAHLFVYGFLTSYSVSTFMAGLETDPRLEDFRRTMKSRLANRASSRQGHRGSMAGPTNGMDQESHAAGQAPYDGYDTSSGSESSTYGEDAEFTAQEARKAAEEEVQRRKQQALAAQRHSSSEPEPYQDSLGDDGYVFDDASPVSPTERQRGAQQSSQGGSAWERLRRQASSSQNVQPRGNSNRPTGSWQRRRDEEQTSRGAREGTSYNFSTADEERAYAKEQAQKEFDEMLERERRGNPKE